MVQNWGTPKYYLMNSRMQIAFLLSAFLPDSKLFVFLSVYLPIYLSIYLHIYLSSLNVKQICLLKKLGKYKKAHEQIKLTHGPDTETVCVSLRVC